jgi:hypothetical protein
MRPKLLEEGNYGTPAAKRGRRRRGFKYNQTPKSCLKLFSNGRSSQVHRRNVNVKTLHAILIDAVKEPQLRVLDHRTKSAHEVPSNVRPDPMLTIRTKNCGRRKDGELSSPSL